MISITETNLNDLAFYSVLCTSDTVRDKYGHCWNNYWQCKIEIQG